jgi:uncharacterized membrane protein
LKTFFVFGIYFFLVLNTYFVFTIILEKTGEESKNYTEEKKKRYSNKNNKYGKFLYEYI